MIRKRKTTTYPKGYPASATQVETANRHAARRYKRHGGKGEPTEADLDRIEAAARKRERKGMAAD
jgi:hypothetical protein